MSERASERGRKGQTWQDMPQCPSAKTTALLCSMWCCCSSSSLSQTTGLTWCLLSLSHTNHREASELDAEPGPLCFPAVHASNTVKTDTKDRRRTAATAGATSPLPSATTAAAATAAATPSATSSKRGKGNSEQQEGEQQQQQ